MQVNALSSIVADLAAANSAAHNPQAWGIVPPEMTVAPGSIGLIAAAKTQIVAVEAAVLELLQRIESEAASQDKASGGGIANLGGARPVIDSVRWTRNWVSMPRGLFETPAALRMLWKNPALWRTVVQPSQWGIRTAVAGSSALKTFTRTLSTPVWVRSSYQWASNLKFQNYIDPDFAHSRFLHAKPPAWTNVFHNAKWTAGAKSAAAGIGKGFGALGVGVGVLNLATGLSGMADGDVSSEDAWAVADGVVGTITSIGSFAPPPAGLVFAGVGAAYTAGRWLFGEGANGKTGIETIGGWGKSAGSAISDASDAVGGAVADGAKAVGGAVADGAEAVGDLVDDVWPW
jgi:hypothetical protein